MIGPAERQGTRENRTKEGAREAGGEARRKCLTPVAMALMWPGVPVMDCASMRPCVSKTPQARSCDSRTMVLKAVRMRAICCSLTTASSRFQSTSRVTGSSARVSTAMLPPHHHIPQWVHFGPGAGADDEGRFLLLDDRRALERRAGAEAIPVIHGRVDEAPALGEVGGTAPFQGPPAVRLRPGCQPQPEEGLRPAHLHAPVERLQPHPGAGAAVEALIGLLEARAELWQ